MDFIPCPHCGSIDGHNEGCYVLNKLASLTDNPNVKNYRTTYRTKKLPREKGEKVLTKLRELEAFLREEAVTTDERIAAFMYPMDSAISMIKGDIEAQKYFEAHGYDEDPTPEEPL